MQGNFMAVKSWWYVDMTVVLWDTENIQLQEAEEGRKDTVLDPNLIAAFNFKKDDNRVTGFEKWGGDIEL